MVVLTVIADFCQDPDANILQMVEPNTYIYNITAYYLTCEGQNIFKTVLNPAQQYIDIVDQGLQNSSVFPSCTSNPNYTNAIRQVDFIQSNFTAIYTSCPPIEDEFRSLANNVCKDSFNPIFGAWLGIYLTLGNHLTLINALPYIYFIYS